MRLDVDPAREQVADLRGLGEFVGAWTDRSVAASGSSASSATPARCVEQRQQPLVTNPSSVPPMPNTRCTSTGEASAGEVPKKGYWSADASWQAGSTVFT